MKPAFVSVYFALDVPRGYVKVGRTHKYVTDRIHEIRVSLGYITEKQSELDLKSLEGMFSK